MLISKTAKVKWNSKIKKHYVELGYTYTKMGDEFEVNVEDLTSGSSSLVKVRCDYCGRIYETQWQIYLNSKKKYIKLDCCNNPECTGKKAKQTLCEKYNVESFREIPGVKEKIKQTNLEKYGCENVFGCEEIKNKIKQTNSEKYGVDYYTQTDESKARYKSTCLERYGVDNFSKTTTFREMLRGENSPVWKGDAATTKREGRELPEYRDWRKSVFSRDLYTCQCCGSRNGNGKYVRLEAHHIKDWKNNINDRYSVENGITLCQKCHTEFHSMFGKKGNNEQQYNEFINLHLSIDKKIC